jgi:hypothetical protein
MRKKTVWDRMIELPGDLLRSVRRQDNLLKSISAAEFEDKYRSLLSSVQMDEFRSKLQAGDEIWTYCMPTEIWRKMAKQEPVCIIRADKMVHYVEDFPQKEHNQPPEPTAPSGRGSPLTLAKK